MLRPLTDTDEQAAGPLESHGARNAAASCRTDPPSGTSLLAGAKVYT